MKIISVSKNRVALRRVDEDFTNRRIWEITDLDRLD